MKDLNEGHPISIHKMSMEKFELEPGEIKTVSFIVFARRAGLQPLKYFKVIDLVLKDNLDHKTKGYTFEVPKFQVVPKA